MTILFVFVSSVFWLNKFSPCQRKTRLLRQFREKVQIMHEANTVREQIARSCPDRSGLKMEGIESILLSLSPAKSRDHVLTCLIMLSDYIPPHFSSCLLNSNLHNKQINDHWNVGGLNFFKSCAFLVWFCVEIPNFML